MAHNLLISLELTVLGMSLVFASILLLWLVMAVLVRLTADRPGVTKQDEAQVQDTASQDRKRRAATAAVAAALARSKEDTLHEFPLPPTAIVSAWQAVRRGSNLNRRGPVR